MIKISWFIEKYEKFMKQSKAIVMTLIFAKFLFGVGLGVLLANYLRGYNWQLYGWLLIIVSLLLHLPAIYKVLIKK